MHSHKSTTVCPKNCPKCFLEYPKIFTYCTYYAFYVTHYACIMLQCDQDYYDGLLGECSISNHVLIHSECSIRVYIELCNAAQCFSIYSNC